MQLSRCCIILICTDNVAVNSNYMMTMTPSALSRAAPRQEGLALQPQRCREQRLEVNAAHGASEAQHEHTQQVCSYVSRLALFGF